MDLSIPNKRHLGPQRVFSYGQACVIFISLGKVTEKHLANSIFGNSPGIVFYWKVERKYWLYSGKDHTHSTLRLNTIDIDNKELQLLLQIY